jgi:hypothetical protein
MFDLPPNKAQGTKVGKKSGAVRNLLSVDRELVIPLKNPKYRGIYILNLKKFYLNKNKSE